MARPYFVQDLYVNAHRRFLVDASGNPLASADAPQFFREETVLLRFHIVDDDGDPWPFNGTDAFEFGADPDYSQGTAVDLLSEDDQFNITGDWLDSLGAEVPDPAAGLICCRVNTNTSGFNTAVGTASELLSGCYLKVCTDLVTPVWATVFDADCSYRNIRRTNLLIPEEVTGPDYLTAVQTAALMDANYPTTAKATPVDADGFSLWDSVASFARKKITWAEIVAAMKTAMEAAYGLLTGADKTTLTGGVSSSADTLHGHETLISVATATILGRVTAGSGLSEELNATQVRTLIGQALHNVTATTAPAVTDDSGDGYGVGSLWIDVTGDDAYVCVDATEGAAVWLASSVPAALTAGVASVADSLHGHEAIINVATASILGRTAAGSGASEELTATQTRGLLGQVLDKLDATAAPAVGDDTADGYAPGSVWVDVTNDRSYTCLDASAGAAIWREIALPVASQSESETGTETAVRSLSPLRVFQAIAAKVLALLGADNKVLYRASGAIATLDLRTSVRATGTADDTSIVTEAAARAMQAASHTISGTFTANTFYALTTGGTWAAFDPATHAGQLVGYCATTDLLTLPGPILADSGASYTPGSAIYAAASGGKTQTVPDPGNVCPLGWGLTATSLVFAPDVAWQA